VTCGGKLLEVQDFCDWSGDFPKDRVLDDVFVAAIAPHEVFDDHPDLERINLLIGILFTDRR
jgi:hypothetical protein